MIINLAENIVEQWEKHDKFRVLDEDSILFHDGKQPNDVLIAKQFIKAVETIKLMRNQYLGCGGSLSSTEILDAIHFVADDFLHNLQ
jgi:hypothetical protein